jgi:hypothetical protein
MSSQNGCSIYNEEELFMDDKTKADIEAGVPMVIVHWDKDGNVTSQEAFNLENISLTEWQMQSLARAALEGCKRFYADPENVKKLDEWKEKRMPGQNGRNNT